MINGLEGIPGSGKSYEAVCYHVLANLAKGRLVITNLPLLVDMIAAINPDYRSLLELRIRPLPVRGTWDPERVVVDDNGVATGSAFELFADGHEVAAPAGTKPFGHVWDYYHVWKDKSGRGPVYIIDECHNALPKFRTSEEVIQWFKLHRHFNTDVLLMTQKFRDMCQEIAGLIAMLVKTRKADILGYSDSYIRKVHAGYRGAVISTEKRKYKPEIFQLYKSHTQGNSVAESVALDVSPLSVKLRRWTWGMWALALVACVYAFWPKSKSVPVNQPSHVVVTSSPVPVKAASAPLGVAVPALSASEAQAAQPPDLEPLKDKLIHITGWMRNAKGAVHSFAVSASGITQFTVYAADLVAAGYTYEPLGECMGYLKWKTKTRTVTCDAPAMAVGSTNAPIVMDAGTGRSTADVRRAQGGSSPPDIDKQEVRGVGGFPPSSEAKPAAAIPPRVRFGSQLLDGAVRKQEGPREAGTPA